MQAPGTTPKTNTASRVKASLAGIVLGAAGLTVTLSAAEPLKAAPEHSRLAAVYEIRFAGLKLGKFEVWSNVNEESYSLRGKGHLKFITGLIFEISGGTTSTGAVTDNGPRPMSFAFDFDTGKHKGELAMKFEGDSVSHVMAKPPFVDHPKDIPVTAAHVKGVLDPLSAMFFTAKASNPNPDGSVCPKRVPVFDGKQRFDLVLSHKRTVQVKKRKKGGYGGPAIVCRIKYIPIAGYKPDNSGVKYMEERDDIEVWLIPVPNEDMYVPYHVVLPTPIGKATATTAAFQIETPSRQKITLVR